MRLTNERKFKHVPVLKLYNTRFKILTKGRKTIRFTTYKDMSTCEEFRRNSVVT